MREWISMCPGSERPGPISAHTGYSRCRIAGPVVGELLVDGVELAALRGGAVQLRHEHRRPTREFGSCS